MLYWLWITWVYTVAFFCTVNAPLDIGAPANTPGVFGHTMTRKCQDWAMQQMDNVGNVLFRHPDFQKLVFSLDSSWEKQTLYGWANMTVLVPDPNSQEWKDIGLIQELERNGCNKTNSKKKCPRTRRFIEHHLVDSSLGKEGKKKKTKAGKKIWWERVGDYSYIYPQAVKILDRTEASNGEIILIEKPLWEEVNGS